MIRPERRSLVRTLIYPVPDPEFPFLGVHLTNTIHGELEAGPNAVFAFAREGYGWDRVNLGDLRDTLRYPGFWAMAKRYWKMGTFEMYRSLSKRAFVHALQRLVPDLQAEDLVPGGAGVRAQAVSPDGSLVDDFRIVADRGRDPRAQRAVARGDRLAGHRPPHRRPRHGDGSGCRDGGPRTGPPCPPRSRPGVPRAASTRRVRRASARPSDAVRLERVTDAARSAPRRLPSAEGCRSPSARALRRGGPVGRAPAPPEPALRHALRARPPRRRWRDCATCSTSGRRRFPCWWPRPRSCARSWASSSTAGAWPWASAARRSPRRRSSTRRARARSW